MTHRIEIHASVGELRAAVAEARRGALTEAEGWTVILADNLLSMFDDPGDWSVDDRGGWIEVERVGEDERDRLLSIIDGWVP